MLHIFRYSQEKRQRLDLCLNAMTDEDSLILIEDGAYLATQALAAKGAVFVLQQDLSARGLENARHPHIIAIDDDEFVRLCVNDNSLTW